MPGLILLAMFPVALRSREDTRTTQAKSSRALATLPPIMLWAWERPENLSFIDPVKTGVAYLAKTIYLRGQTMASRPRLQPLRLAEGTKLVAVVRIESDRVDPPALTTDQLKGTATEVGSLAKLPGVLAIQIDFDAVSSERDFYRRLLIEVRQQLPGTTALSITALASWCAGDNWLSDLPLDEAVPMFFRMGVEGPQFSSRLKAGTEFLEPPCTNAAGVSTDEKLTPPRVPRLYIFSPNPWTQDSANKAMEDYKQ